MNELVNRFSAFVKRKQLFDANDHLLLAVSGGVDSVVLCELCHQAGFQFSIAHCNFQLRGEESDRDEEFVKGIADKYRVELRVKKFHIETYASENKLSIQEAARKLRYEWFFSLLNNYQYILTAHHAGDNIETLLMNFFRGTGIKGLTGIPLKAGRVVRPLLDLPKQKLIDFAVENNLTFVEDSSNQSSKYTRNFFRNEILPAIANVYPQVHENLHHNIHRFRETEKLYRLGLAAITKKLCRKKGKEVHIPVKQLMGIDNRALIYEIIDEYGFNEKQIDEVVKLATAQSGSYMQSPDGKFRIIRHRHWFIIAPGETGEAENIVIDSSDKKVIFALGKLIIKTTGKKTSDIVVQDSVSGSIAVLDHKYVSYPLLLRMWKTGDYFYPLGMKKKKKLSRFFIDKKISKTEKEKIWVIESAGRIIWVVGHRIDERCKVTEHTETVVHLQLTPE